MDRATNITRRTTGGATLGGFEYEYDAVGRIVSRSHAIDSNAFDRVYAYDDLDRLASDDGVTYTYDDGWQVIADLDEQDNVIASYTWGEGIDNRGRSNRCANLCLIGSWIWHHYVREYLNAPLPETPPSVVGTGWRKLSRKESVFHDNGDEYEECKYVHKDGREVVYDGRTNEIITDTVYKGTYNFVNPGTADDGWIEYSARFVGHGVLDVIPYLIMGN